MISPSAARTIERQAGPRALRTPKWKDLYVAALFEKDPARTISSISEARSALVSRARELFLEGGTHGEEQTAIDETLVALQAFERYTHNGLEPKRSSDEPDRPSAGIPAESETGTETRI
jgi:hypothetical protein